MTLSFVSEVIVCLHITVIGSCLLSSTRLPCSSSFTTVRQLMTSTKVRITGERETSIKKFGKIYWEKIWAFCLLSPHVCLSSMCYIFIYLLRYVELALSPLITCTYVGCDAVVRRFVTSHALIILCNKIECEWSHRGCVRCCCSVIAMTGPSAL